MTRIGNALVVFAAIGLYGCATVPTVPTPSDSRRAGIGISITIRAPAAIFTVSAARIYFVRVEGGPDTYLQENLLVSNYAHGGYVYLLDIPPGRYVAVAAGSPSSATGQRGESVTVFARDVIKLTDTTVAPGSVTFAGEYVLDTAGGLKAADDAQLHYLSLFEPGARTISPIMRSGKFYYAGSLRESKRDPDSQRRFLSKALEDLESGGWTAAVRRALEQGAGSPRP